MAITSDLKIEPLGHWPHYEIKNPRLREFLGRDHLGADLIVSHLQKAVSESVSFNEGLETKILEEIEQGKLEENTFNKLASSILRGHSLDGTAGLVLGIQGTKLLDSALTGLIPSRSFVTSGRRAKIEKENIIVPEILEQTQFGIFKKKYLDISEKAIDVYNNIIETFGPRQGKQIASKAIPYNNPGNLYIVLPLSSIVSLSLELEHQKNEGTIYFPREIEKLISEVEGSILPKAGMNVMYETRKKALADTYLHLNVFKSKKPNLATELSEWDGNPLNPILVSHNAALNLEGFRNSIDDLVESIKLTHSIRNPVKKQKQARKNMLKRREMIERYNNAISITTISSLSYRVWSEQKRHATLPQHVESIYSGSDNSLKFVEPVWQEIRERHEQKRYFGLEELTEKLDYAFVIPSQLKSQGKEKLLLDYLHISCAQHMLRKEMLLAGIEERDAIYIVPRNTRLRTSEHYDLANIIGLELPLRLCTTCEPERLATSQIKAQLIKDSVKKEFPGLGYLIEPKCILGYCSEQTYCDKIHKFNPGYNKNMHEEIRKNQIAEVKSKL